MTADSPNGQPAMTKKDAIDQCLEALGPEVAWDEVVNWCHAKLGMDVSRRSSHYYLARKALQQQQEAPPSVPGKPGMLTAGDMLLVNMMVDVLRKAVNIYGSAMIHDLVDELAAE